MREGREADKNVHGKRKLRARRPSVRLWDLITVLISPGVKIKFCPSKMGLAVQSMVARWL